MSSESRLSRPLRPGPSRRLSLIVRSGPSRNQSGAAAVEFVLVAIPLFFILYALIAFGMMLALKQSVTNAAAEGARAVVGVVDDPVTTGVDERVKRAQDTVSNRLSWLGGKYQPSDLTVGWYNSSTNSCATAAVGTPVPSPATICVRIAYPYGTRPLIPTAPGLGLITPSTLGSEARVQVGS